MSIHIKPENKGKFTAYKKRTGKTTEEALHSKDPHVRKMAQFSKNASHWHHATGGLINSYGLGGDIGQAGGALAGQALIPIPGVGGIIGGAVGGFLGNTVDKMFTPSNYNSAAMKNSNPYGYATGGSTQQISPNAVEVTGAPNVTDGNSVNVNGTQINADHGEVIDSSKGIVFSDLLFDPRTGKKFSDEAKKIEKATNKLKGDSVINQSTAKALDRNKMNLFGMQEKVATALGFRNQDGSTVQPQSHATGGSIADILTFHSNPNKTDSNGIKIGSHSHVKHSKNRTESSAAPSFAYGGRYAIGGTPQPLTPQSEWLKGPWDNPADFNTAFVANQTRLAPGTKAMPGSNLIGGDLRNPNRPPYLDVTDYAGYDPKNQGSASNLFPEINPPVRDRSEQQLNPLPMLQRGVKPPTTAAGQLKDVQDLGIKTDPGFYPDPSKGNGLGLGDYLQLGSAGASLLGAVLDTPETQKLYTNNAPITNQQFDPSRALMNNTFTTNAARQDLTNTYSASGANANLQNLYANKFKADADTTTHYDQMNKQATTDYENRLGQRTAENNQMRYHTDDVNMANRATYMNNIYGALATVNQVGAGFNKGETGKMALKYLMQIDPEASKWVLGGGNIEDYYKKKYNLAAPVTSATPPSTTTTTTTTDKK